MIFGNRHRVEEDLERIRQANLSPEELEEQQEKAAAEKEETIERLKEFTFKDFLAMVLAALSIIVPYFLIFSAIMALFVFLFYRFFL